MESSLGLQKRLVEHIFGAMSILNASRERLLRPVERLTPNPKLRLREQCREVMRFQHFSLRTEPAYGDWIKRFLVFCRDPNPLTPARPTRECQP